MDEIVRRAVARAIVTMRENLGEDLTIDDLARSAMFSKFHFSRVFHRVTGLSPGRFLSALRLAEAKRLLLTTAVSVADISHQVGYNSVGTFSARFSNSVGVSPTAYRRMCGQPSIPERPTAQASGLVVRGQLWRPAATEISAVFVGLFPHRIAEGAPARHSVLHGPGQYVLENVPAGSWYLLAHALGTAHGDDTGPRPYVGLTGPLTVRPGLTATLADIRLKPRRGFDPPLLLALPDLRRVAVQQPVAVA
ncbi:MAG TPA: AraC family transcriptional regulator [Amycolatopsis sp.]|nr:AraC family transcriptional regulator [Amycolatopsis sp.]